MKKLIIAIILFPILSLSQDLKCSDFKTGNFTMTSEEYPNIKIKIFRDDTMQIEQLIDNDSISAKLPKDKIREKIQWIDDCHYKLFFEDINFKEDEIGKFINKNGGILTEIISIKNRCYKYKSTFIINGKSMEIKGEICKEEYN